MSLKIPDSHHNRSNELKFWMKLTFSSDLWPMTNFQILRLRRLFSHVTPLPSENREPRPLSAGASTISVKTRGRLTSRPLARAGVFCWESPTPALTRAGTSGAPTSWKMRAPSALRMKRARRWGMHARKVLVIAHYRIRLYLAAAAAVFRSAAGHFSGVRWMQVGQCICKTTRPWKCGS